LSTPPPVANDLAVKKKHPELGLFITFLIAAVLLYYTLRGLDWATFWNALTNGHYEFLLLTIPITTVNFFLRSARWDTLVSAEKKVPIISIFWANMVGYMGNAYLPARAGEIIRSVYLGKKSGAGTSFIFATALVERLLDVIALVIIGSISVLYQSQISAFLAGAVKIMTIAGVIGLVLVIVAPFQEKLIASLIIRVPLPSKILKLINEQVARFLVGMRSLHNGRRLASFIFLTVVIWIIDGLGNMINVRIISQTLNLGQVFILLAALGLSSAIPSTPGYVGIYQFVAVSVLVPFGFSRPNALAFILILQVVNYLVVSFWGLIGLWQINRVKNEE
jgi:glycosyltransferase 2 family protein